MVRGDEPQLRNAKKYFVGLVAMLVSACAASANTTSNDAGADASTLGECAPPTAVLPVSGSTVWPNSAVPRGSCLGSVSCEILIDPCCHPVGTGDPIDHYLCACTQGAWQCNVTRGTEACADPDGGGVYPSCPETGG